VELPTAIDVSSVLGLIAVGILTAQILLGLLLSPVLERALESWMPVARIAPSAQNSGSHGNSGKGSDNSASWDLRSMWN